MDKPSEIKFLMSHYENLKQNLAKSAAIDINKTFCEQVKSLIEYDDISEESFGIIKQIYDIKEKESMEDVFARMENELRASRIPATAVSDPCSHGYSGSFGGGRC